MDIFDEDIDKEETNGKIPFRDKRRFNADGEQVLEDEPAIVAEPAKSAAETSLEAALLVEKERRVAAEAKLVGVQAKFEEAKAGLERETSEMRERLKKTLEAKASQDQFNFLTTLLPVLDNLNLAVQASETDPSVEHLRDGVIGTARSFEQALISVGVQPVPSVGETFDPELHEAVDMKPVDADDDGKVTAEYARGYRFRDKLLRPARVQVGRGMAGHATK
ncbi:MAG TPA: nucleotide exchange factor GrpE [Pyrinomonadaceae bacterium]|jgi:molecular chaperone GrpE|nr:nucleotide exchange factor GrpE [Pyrinomonadaceae bacterium]